MNTCSVSGSYYGCDHNYIQHSEKEFSVDPLSPASHTPWDLRATPSVAWENNDTDLFTLFVVDVPNRFFHGIFTNIPGSNIQKAEVRPPKSLLCGTVSCYESLYYYYCHIILDFIIFYIMVNIEYHSYHYHHIPSQ